MQWGAKYSVEPRLRGRYFGDPDFPYVLLDPECVHACPFRETSHAASEQAVAQQGLGVRQRSRVWAGDAGATVFAEGRVF